MTWNNLVHFYIRLTKLILKQHNCLTHQVSTFRCEIAPPNTQAEWSPCLTPVIVICSLPRWLSATTYPPRLTSENTNPLWGLMCRGGEREDKNKNLRWIRQLLKISILNTQCKRNLIKLKQPYDTMVNNKYFSNKKSKFTSRSFGRGQLLPLRPIPKI